MSPKSRETMTGVKTETFTIISEVYTTESPNLRFIERDGRNILQYSERRRYRAKEEWVWVDVPLIQDSSSDIEQA